MPRGTRVCTSIAHPFVVWDIHDVGDLSLSPEPSLRLGIKATEDAAPRTLGLEKAWHREHTTAPMSLALQITKQDNQCCWRPHLQLPAAIRVRLWLQEAAKTIIPGTLGLEKACQEGHSTAPIAFILIIFSVWHTHGAEPTVSSCHQCGH